MSVFDYDPEFIKEISYSPRDEELGDIKAPGPVGSVGGFAGRMLRKNVADPIRGMYRSVKKAQEGRFDSTEEMGRAALEFAGNLAGAPGGVGGLGSGARLAKPWQSRTLDTITGVLPAGKKFPDSATPQTWMSKLKGAGLPKEEVEVAESFLTKADPKTKFNKEQLSWALENKLPEMGVTRTELGGPEWVAGQKRLDELNNIIEFEAPQKSGDRIRELYAERGGPVSREEYMQDPKWRALQDERIKLLEEHSQLAQDAVGKRPYWPQYNIEGAENPREVLYHAKPKSGESEYINSDMETHYGQDKGKNLLFHQREAELTLPDGKKSTHISEQQSDWHSEFAASKDHVLYRDPESGNIKLKRKDIEIKPADDGTYYIDAAGNYDGYYTKEYAEKLLKDRINSVGTSPEPPMKDTWYKMGFKDAVKRAVEAGHDYVTWDTADTQIKRWPAGEGAGKYFKQHYDEKLVKLAAKEYGAKPEQVPLRGTKDNPVVEFPAEDFDMPFSQPVPVRELSIVPGNRRLGQMPGKFYITHPDYPGLMDTEWNGFKSEQDAKIFLKDIETELPSQKVWQIPVTEDIKRKVLLEGQYFSKRTAKPGGRNAEGVA